MSNLIKVSKSAILQLRKIITNHSGIFFGAKGGGCNGFQYTIEPGNGPWDSLDEKITIGGVPMVICGKTMFMVIGTEIDWKVDTMGSRFVFDNPQATSTCGCNKTFSVDF